MKTDDRDMDSSNPSKNFKVGDFDHLSGFFTPVWESNRRVRSESSSPATVGAGAGSVPDSGAPDSHEPAAPTLGDAASATSEAERRKGSARKASMAAGKATPSRAGAEGASPKSKGKGFARAGAKPKAKSAEPKEAPSAAKAASRRADPSLPKEDFIDSEPEFRAAVVERDAPVAARAPAAERAPARPLVHERSLRASAAATAVHERLKAKLSEVVTPPDVDSALDSARGRAFPVTSGNEDACPPHVLRQLRRTLRLSTPLPESIRALVAQYNRN